MLLNVSFPLLILPNIVNGGEVITQTNPSAEADRLFDRGFELFQQGTAESLKEAIAKWQEALLLFRKTGNLSREAVTLNNIAAVYDKLGEKQTALNFYEQALPLRRQVGDRPGEARTLNNIGFVYDSLGEKQTALHFYEQALPLRRKVGDRYGEATTLNNIGLVYDSIGEKQTALNFYQQALTLRQELGDRSGEADSFNNIGFVYDSLGEKQTALDFYEQALPIYQQVREGGREATTLNNIGLVYDSLGEKETALDFYQQALPLYQQVGDRSGKATTLNNIALVYDGLGKKQIALNFYQQALPLYEQVGDRSGEATTLNNIGLVYDGLGEKQIALDFYEQALPIYERVGDRDGEAITFYNIARVQRDENKLTESLIFIEKALEIIENLRTKVASAELRTSYFATVQDRYEFYIDLLMQLHQQQPNQGYDAKAFHASERSRARTLLELLNEASVDIRQGIDPQLATAERKLQQQLNTIETQRIQILSREYTPEQKAKIEETRDKLIDEYDKLRANIRTTSPNYAALTQPQPLTLKEIQQEVLDNDTLLLQYSLGEKSSYLWAVTKDSINSYQLPPQAEIKNAATELMRTITDPRKRNDIVKIDSAADELTEIILKPVADKFNKKRLLIVGDRFLQYIPFSTLSIPNTAKESDGYQPLIVNHEIVNLPSASTIANIRNSTKSRKLAPKKLAILADPVFSREDGRVISANSEQLSVISSQTTAASTSENPSRNFPLESQQLDRAARDVGIRWDRLPGTRTEAEAIMALVPESKRTQAFDFQANRETATSQKLGEYQIVHFATHGFANSKQPELSGIIMSLVDKNGNWQNGFLRLNDIFNLNLPAELVVLSACQTALGKDIKGEGLVGLTRGFMYAGAKRVVGSLWLVDDNATAQLMLQFYQGILEQELSPAEALRVTQLEMWQQGMSPYYWGAFTLQGEWELEVRSQKSEVRSYSSFHVGRHSRGEWHSPL
ncbi:MAG: CHAT domain-containing protein [Okeania sp. SIO3I5]|uniref:CHAT domain-containing tetratricopeptide repeat protein n=1 Tax=Okeania sp. SIO3I5 TaxID=2607805 RepID=UPI0013B5E37A|nr:CHAT domain-containing protein [Okeania sp. SIO3I5]